MQNISIIAFSGIVYRDVHRLSSDDQTTTVEPCQFIRVAGREEYYSVLCRMFDCSGLQSILVHHQSRPVYTVSEPCVIAGVSYGTDHNRGSVPFLVQPTTTERDFETRALWPPLIISPP